jgi:hypothetical protein
MNCNLYIFYFDYKSQMDLEGKTIVDNTVYTDIKSVLKKAVQMGRAFSPDGAEHEPNPSERSLVFSSDIISVYVLPLVYL